MEAFWKKRGTPMKFEAVIGSRSIGVEKIDEKRFRIGDSEQLIDIQVIEPGVYSLIVDGHSYEAAVREEKKGFVVEIGAHAIPVRLQDPTQVRSGGAKEFAEGEAVIESPMPGRVVTIKVQVGATVQEGEGIIIVEAMKMENELHAPKGGKIKSIAVKVGDAVEAGQELVVIE